MPKILTMNPQDLLADRKVRDYSAELFLSIQDQGQLIPIIVTPDLVVVDGLVRAEIAIKLGHPVQVIVAEEFPAVCDIVAELHEKSVAIGFPPFVNTRRVHEFHQAILPLVRKANGRARKAGRFISNKEQKPKGENNMILRKSITRAMGLHSDHGTQTIISLYNGLKGPHARLARQMIKEHEEGRLSVGQALARFQQLRDGSDFFLANAGTQQSVTEQKIMLHNATSRLGGILRGLLDLGELSPEWGVQELKQIAKTLALHRRALARFITMFEERARSNEQD